MEKYVGFDCDECLAQVTQLMPFTESAGATHGVLEKFAELVAQEDIPFIRPTFWPLLEKISKTAAKPFIYSNNGSIITLEFINLLVSMRIGRPRFFQAVAHYDNRNRTDNINGQYVKKWPSVKQFIEREFRVQDVKPEQVMFFDDLPHRPLAGPLGKNYIRVTPFELPCVIGEEVFSVDNSHLLELWSEAGGDPGLVEVEESEDAGMLEEAEAGRFEAAFDEFIAGWQVAGRRRRARLGKTKKRRG